MTLNKTLDKNRKKILRIAASCCKVDVVTEDAVSPYIRDQILRDAVSL
jgi:predicted nucleotidyltransferase